MTAHSRVLTTNGPSRSELVRSVALVGRQVKRYNSAPRATGGKGHVARARVVWFNRRSHAIYSSRRVSQRNRSADLRGRLLVRDGAHDTGRNEHQSQRNSPSRERHGNRARFLSTVWYRALGYHGTR